MCYLEESINWSQCRMTDRAILYRPAHLLSVHSSNALLSSCSHVPTSSQYLILNPLKQESSTALEEASKLCGTLFWCLAVQIVGHAMLLAIRRVQGQARPRDASHLPIRTCGSSSMDSPGRSATSELRIIALHIFIFEASRN